MKPDHEVPMKPCLPSRPSTPSPIEVPMKLCLRSSTSTPSDIEVPMKKFAAVSSPPSRYSTVSLASWSFWPPPTRGSTSRTPPCRRTRRSRASSRASPLAAR